MGCCCNGEKTMEDNFPGGDVDLSLLDPVLNKYKGVPGSLITILQRAQEIYGYLPREVIRHIAREVGVKPAKVFGVATFYTQFRLSPIGKYLIMLCQGTACHVNGSERIESALCEELKIKEGETTEDGVFTLQNVACLGCCSLAPVMMINGETYGKLTPDKARSIIREIYERENEN
ncbi:NADP-reducing hydrogenase subunit HndA [Koleobacter methoxysyntrophicus]|uniref:NADP-reducing hydrogenase subunit HndA n=2 Tax=Koleobacter methoxysyntrophicus TaxID=2751313 RepID=A0A8A0RM54_9FIRM|nr:NADP-reducing hydrogenase subunit HndA [Koleobacter methoxysyntrophicus]